MSPIADPRLRLPRLALACVSLAMHTQPKESWDDKLEPVLTFH